MEKTVYCSKLKQTLPALNQAPYPGALGDKVLNEISLAAWQQWLQHQTMLINEYRLSVIEPKARAFLEAEMEKFLFGEGSEAPEGFVPVDKS